jgi:hypothetical protein
MMQPVALDLSSFSDDIAAGRLPSQDWPRAARDVGAYALDLPLDWLLSRDEVQKTLLRQELQKRGVVIAAARVHDLCHLDDPPSHFGAPAWTARWYDACRALVEGGWGAGLAVLRPPPSENMFLFNKVAANLSRCQLIAEEWHIGISVSNEHTRGCLKLCDDVPGLGVALDGDRLPDDVAERIRALNDLLPHTRLVRLLALGNGEDERVLGAWRGLLDGFGGWISLRWQGTGDPYSGAGTAIKMLRGTETRTAPPRRTTAPHHRCL